MSDEKKEMSDNACATWIATGAFIVFAFFIQQIAGCQKNQDNIRAKAQIDEIKARIEVGQEIRLVPGNPTPQWVTKEAK